MAQKLVGDYLAAHPCSSCGEVDLRVLDFHHKDEADKAAEVGRMINKFYSLQAIILEIAKCEVMCKNCHAKHHQTDDWRSQYLKENQ